MNWEELAYVFALGANLCFSSASLVFAFYSVRFSALWMNSFKACVAFVALLLTLPFVTVFSLDILPAIASLSLSGFIGLNLGDLFLLTAFKSIGAARTLVVFGFQPIAIAWASFFLFGQTISPEKMWGILLLIGCLYLFSFEAYKQKGRWEIRGLVLALIGVGLDTIGILLSRWGFDSAPELSSAEGQFYRCAGALVGFWFISRFRKIGLVENFRSLDTRQRVLVVLASFAGTYLSLVLYMTAVKHGHLASISSIAITGPLFASAIELIYKRERPSIYFLMALGLFCTGFFIFLG